MGQTYTCVKLSAVFGMFLNREYVEKTQRKTLLSVYNFYVVARRDENSQICFPNISRLELSSCFIFGFS